MLTDNQLHKHTSILTVFASSDEHVLLTMFPAELNRIIVHTKLQTSGTVTGEKSEID